ALACLGDDAALAALARAVSELTHADPLAGDACVLWCVAVDRAVREDRLDGAWDGLDLLRGDARRHWRERLAEAETQPPEAFVPNGFVVAALQAAYAAVRQTPVPADRPGAHLEAALRRAVGIGHDTDTVAAIAGALLGARWGWSAIPQRWLRILHGWPDLRAEDLLDLALRTASGGDDDAAGQPGAALPRAHDSMSDPTPPRVGAAAGDDGPPPDTAIDDPPPDTAIDDPPDPPAEALDWDRVLAWQPAIAPERLAAVERRTGGAQDPWGGRAWSGLARDLLRDLDEVGVVAPFDWSAWLQHRGEALLDDASALSDASLEDCRRLLAALARSDRFVEGAWDAALERGTVQAVLGRVAALRGEATSTHRRGAPGRG
ncbi:MAG: ADP-ribosylglycohydrolase family protein, partial [Actinomycetota bacterium]